MLTHAHTNSRGIVFEMAAGLAGDRCDVCGFKIGRLALEAAKVVVCSSECAEEIRPCPHCDAPQAPSAFEDDSDVCSDCVDAADAGATVPILTLA